MRAGQNGRIAISWGQTEIDGLEAAPLSFLCIGAAWSWRGQARYLGEPAEQIYEKSGGVLSSTATVERSASALGLPDESSGRIVLTNGAQQFTAFMFSLVGEPAPMLVFEGECPSRDQDFWISEIKVTEHQSGEAVRMDDTVVAFPSRPKPQTGRDVTGGKPVIAVGHRSD